MNTSMREPGVFSREELQKNLALLQSKNGIDRQKARIALVTLGSPAVDYLAELATHPEDKIRWEAVKGLGQIMDPITAPLLINALEDENTAIRWLAAEGLIRLKKNGLIPLLESLIGQKLTVYLREGAHHILKAMALRYHSGEFDELIKDLETTTDHSQVPIHAQLIMEKLNPAG